MTGPDHIDEAHAAYAAAWAQPYAEIRTADGAEFFQLRRHVLQLSRADVARLLRVSTNAVRGWETDRCRVPFSAFFALRLIAESLRFRLASQAWSNWQLEDGHQMTRTGKVREAVYLKNTETGACFEPEDLNNFWLTAQRVQMLADNEANLKARVEALTRENTELRELFQRDGVTAELHNVREQVQALYEKINTGTVHQLHMKKAAA